jgi:hypothetical protein
VAKGLEVGRREEDPVLGACQVFRDRPDWAWRKVAMFLLGVAAGLIWVHLGSSGFDTSLPSRNALLALWPLLVPFSGVMAWGTWLALVDALGPRCAELRVGEEGFATTMRGRRTDLLWSSVRSVEREAFSSFWGRFGVRVKFLHAGTMRPDGQFQSNGDQSPDDLVFRTDAMVNSRLIAEEMSAARKRWHDKS